MTIGNNRKKLIEPRGKAYKIPTSKYYPINSKLLKEAIAEQERTVYLALTNHIARRRRKEWSEILFMRMELRKNEKVEKIIDGENRLQVIIKPGYNQLAYSIAKNDKEHTYLVHALAILATIEKGSIRYEYDS